MRLDKDEVEAIKEGFQETLEKIIPGVKIEFIIPEVIMEIDEKVEILERYYDRKIKSSGNNSGCLLFVKCAAKELIKELKAFGNEIVAHTIDTNYPMERGLTDNEEDLIERLEDMI